MVPGVGMRADIMVIMLGRKVSPERPAFFPSIKQPSAAVILKENDCNYVYKINIKISDASVFRTIYYKINREFISGLHCVI